MEPLHALAVLITLAAALSYINHRFIKMPMTIGLMLMSLAVPLALPARLISVGLPVTILRRRREFSPRAIRVMTWGGLRGGISVALALSLPAACSRELILTMTYVVVVFSVVVQGLTITRVIGGESKGIAETTP